MIRRHPNCIKDTNDGGGRGRGVAHEAFGLGVACRSLKPPDIFAHALLFVHLRIMVSCHLHASVV